MQLAMIGLGRMGANMVRRLIKDGHQCVVFDMSPKAVAELVRDKAVGAASLAELVRKLEKPRAPDLRDGRREKMLMPESRVHGHDQYLVDVLHDFFENRRGSRRVNGDPDAFSQRSDALHGT